MSKQRLSAILWRRMNLATFDTLAGNSKGQYDIRLGSDHKIADFFAGVKQGNFTPLGGYTLEVPIEPFEGHEPVTDQTISVRYMGEKSERSDWIISSQRPDTAYPLWRQGRGAPEEFSDSPHEFVVLSRDVEGRYHARWVSSDTFDNLPGDLQSHFVKRDVGVLIWELETDG